MPSTLPNDIELIEEVRRRHRGEPLLILLDATAAAVVWANDAGAALAEVDARQDREQRLSRTVGQRRIASAARALGEGQTTRATARLSADIGTPLTTFSIQKLRARDGVRIILVADAAVNDKGSTDGQSVPTQGLEQPVAVASSSATADASAIISPEEFEPSAPSFSDGSRLEAGGEDQAESTHEPRFTWASNGDGVFTDVSHELLDAVEIRRGEIVGRDATGLDPLLHADRDRLGNALADDVAFTHRVVAWAVPRVGLRVPVSFSGVPQTADGKFAGHRGHGKVRIADAVLDPELSGQAEPIDFEADSPASSAPTKAGAGNGLSTGDAGSLSAAEREAFNEIGALLGGDARSTDGLVDADQEYASGSDDAGASAPAAPADQLNEASSNPIDAADLDTDDPADGATATNGSQQAPSHGADDTPAERATSKAGVRATSVARSVPSVALAATRTTTTALSEARATSKVKAFGRASSTDDRIGTPSPDTVEKIEANAPAPSVRKTAPEPRETTEKASGNFERRLARVKASGSSTKRAAGTARSVKVASRGSNTKPVKRTSGKKVSAQKRNAARPHTNTSVVKVSPRAEPKVGKERPRDFEQDLAGLAALADVDRPLPPEDEAGATSSAVGSADVVSTERGSEVAGSDSASSASIPDTAFSDGQEGSGHGSGAEAVEEAAVIRALPDLPEAEPTERMPEVPEEAPSDPTDDLGTTEGTENPDGNDATTDDAVDEVPTRLPRGPIDTTLLEKLPIPVLVQDRRSLLYQNSAFAELTGYADIDELREAGGMGVLFSGSPPTAIGSDDQQSGAIVLQTKDGTRRPVTVQMQGVPWSDGEGEHDAYLVTLRTASERGTLLVGEQDEESVSDGPIALPFTDRRPIETRLATLNQVLDEATDGVVFLDAERNIRALSRSATELLGYQADEIEGRAFAVLFAAGSRQDATQLVESLGGEGPRRGKGVELTAQTTANDEIPVFVTAGALRDEGGYCAVLRDVSEWRRTEESLREAREEAEAASRQKTRFLTRVSHEIRTPLNAIIGFAEVMVEERFGPVANDRYREYLRDISLSGRHVLDLVNDLLDIAKIEAGREDLAFEDVDLNAELNSAVAMVEPQATDGRIIMRTSLGPLPRVVADRRSIRQIALNILSNAVRYTDPGGQVIVSTKAIAGGVTVRVRDTGVGMSQDDIDRALEPFTQVPSRSESMARRAQGGTGLGLPLTKAMAEANRAKFSISSVRGRGTLVELHFPPDRVLR